MTDLLTRLEQAQEGSRELSDEVLLAANWHYFRGQASGYWNDPYGNRYEAGKRPCPTTSLDAALTLTPAHMHWKEILVKALDLLTELWPEGPLSLDMLARCVCIAALRARDDG